MSATESTADATRDSLTRFLADWTDYVRRYTATTDDTAEASHHRQVTSESGVAQSLSHWLQAQWPQMHQACQGYLLLGNALADNGEGDLRERLQALRAQLLPLLTEPSQLAGLDPHFQTLTRLAGSGTLALISALLAAQAKSSTSDQTAWPESLWQNLKQIYGSQLSKVDWQALQQALQVFDAARHKQQLQFGNILLAAFDQMVAQLPQSGLDDDAGLRDVYNHWVAHAEQVYAEQANLPAYQQSLGELVNATMRLRQQMDALLQAQAGLLNLPTREELDQVHHEQLVLRRENRRLKRQVQRLTILLGSQVSGSDAHNGPNITAISRARKSQGSDS